MSIAIQQRGVERVIRFLDKNAKGNTRKELVEAIERATLVVDRNVKEKQMRGNAVKVRSGALRRSVRRIVDKRKLEGAVGTNMRYARILEVGGTIRPKSGKLLTIPLRAAMTAGGRSRGSAREVGARYEATFWRKSEGGQLILYGVNRARATAAGPSPGRLTPLFVGVPSVTIPKKEPFQKAANETGGRVQVELERAAKFIVEGK